jgi:hypothetical protein
MFADAPSLAARLAVEVDQLQGRILGLEADARQATANLANDATAFVESVYLLLQVSEHALTELAPSDPTAEAVRRQCFSAMRGVGRAAETVRHRGGLAVQRALRAVMRCLIDTVYLDLAKPSVEPPAWRETRHVVERRLSGFQAAVVARAREVASTVE